ncbi:hypothetical protein [Allohahella marinimesophila]|uniref:Uncharacterized protein n=1 Tax=Allohahella marinimesophila TaxID=1054972 RepID=A0ABP7NUZ3_9GAMM
MKPIQAALLSALLFVSSTVFAGNDDVVEEVRVCGSDVGVKMATAGWVVALSSTVGAAKVNRIQAVAQALMVSGKRSGYFDNNTAVSSWCGLTDVKSITVLAIIDPRP